MKQENTMNEKQKSARRKEAENVLGDLKNCIQDKISELHNVVGKQTERHAFCHYRALLEEACDLLDLKPYYP